MKNISTDKSNSKFPCYLTNNEFILDDLIITNKDISVFGLNLAIGWPLPNEIKNQYDKMIKNFETFKSHIYFYPYDQTHITLLTLINFKDNINPTPDTIKEIMQIKNSIDKLVSIIIKKIRKSLIQPFKIEIGRPILSNNAVIMPIKNESNEIETLRNILANEIKEKQNIIALKPSIIHSTIGRFIKKINNSEDFKKDFYKISRKQNIGIATINEILLTSETKPYMREGKILKKYKI